MRRRLLAIFLTLTMALAVFPASALATGDDPDTGEPSEDTPTCICTELCTEEGNPDCPVCLADYSACKGTAPEETGDEPTEEPGEPQQPESTLTEESTQVEQLQARIDALPSAEELSAMGNEERDAAYLEAIAIDDTIQELPDEEQALLKTTKLDTVFEWFNAQVAAQPEGDPETAEEPEGTEDDPWDISADGEGNDVYAYLTENSGSDPITYTLHIAGTGAMKDYGFGGQNLPQENSITKVEIHEGVTEIGDWAFHGIANLAEVSLPNSLERIGSSAFQGISNFSATILIGPNVTEIGENAFYSTNITAYELDENNTAFLVKDGILYSTDGKTLISCPGGKRGAFNETWLEGVETIADYAFRGCKQLSGTVKFPANVTSIGAFAFQNCTQLQEVSIPDTVQGAIGEYTFNGCTALEEVTIGSGITNIGQSAFQACSKMTKIDLTSATFDSIGINAFQGCSSLTALDIPDAVTGTIGENAFSGCSALGSIAIGDGITSIGSQAFANCTKSAASGTTLTLGDSITTIADDAFSGSTNFTGDLTIPDSMTGTLGQVFRHCGFNGKLTISDGITEIAQSAFNGSEITGLDLGEGVQKIGQSAFYSTALTGDLIIPDSVTEIGYIAFSSCKGLNGKLVLSKNLKTLGNLAFSSCNFSGTVIIPDSLKTIPTSAFNSTNSESYISCFVIPSSVTSIGNAALFNQHKNAIYYLEDASKTTLLTNTNSNGSIAITNGGRFADSTEFGADTLATPIKDGCKFDGWYFQNGTNGNDWGTTVTGEIDVSQDETYYAKWTPVTDYGIDSGDKNKTLTMAYGGTPASTTVDVTVPKGGSISKVESSNDAIKAKVTGTTVTIAAADNLNAGTYAGTVYVYAANSGDGAAGSTYWIEVTLTVNKAGSTVAPDEGDITATYGNTITLTAEVEKAQIKGIALMDTARDTVDFYCGDTSLGSVKVSYTSGGTYTEGTATLIYDTSQNGIPVGTTSTITAVYGGSVNLNGSKTNSIQVTLNKINTSIDIAPDRTPLIGGGTVTLTVDTSKLPEGGTVSVSCDKDDIKIVENDNGTYTAEMPNRGGEYTFTAVYNGDAWYNGATATCTVTVVTKATPVEPVAVGYLVEHYLEGRWGYELEDTEFFTGKIGDTVTAQPKDYPGYRYNERISTASGTLTAIEDEGDIVTLKLYYDERTISRPSGGSSEPSYTVSVEDLVNGTVETDPRRAQEGEEVTITVTPDDGYELDTLTVIDRDGDEVEVTEERDGTFTFEMPDSRVTIEATFVPVAEDIVPEIPTDWANPYADVAANAWYYDAVAYVTANGLMTGTSATTFAPDATTTRAMIWTVLARMNGQNVDGGTPWYAMAQSWAVTANVSDGTNPADPISREELATMLYRAAGSPAVSGNLLSYPDGSSVAAWAESAMLWATQNGIISGIDGMLTPQGQATRAQVATMLMRFREAI